jgi:hypothetical protein
MALSVVESALLISSKKIANIDLKINEPVALLNLNRFFATL